MEKKSNLFKKIFKIFFILLALIFIAGIFFAYFFVNQISRSNNIGTPTIYRIKSEQTISMVAKDLYDQKLISSQQFFKYGARAFWKNFKPGFYEIPANASIKSVLTLFQSGETKTVKITFPEGWRMEQMAVKLDEAGIVDYASFVAAAKKYEGKLFPDTYFMNPVMTSEEIIEMMTDDYLARTENLTVSNDDLIIASIVEREAANDQDRALIAGIYKNRLKIGMKLQSDPTVEYGRDTNNLAKMDTASQKEYTFWKSAKTIEFTSVVSKYNTYQVAGLPIGPLCSPGLASIKATLSPTTSNYYFFLYGEDGKIYPAKNQAEHESNIAKYM